MKKLLRRVPGLVTAHHHVMYWWPIVRDTWHEDPQTMNDRSHLRRDWDFEVPAEQERHELMLAAVKAHGSDTAGARVLELGCSDGVFTARLARCCSSVTACDISPVALELAARRCHQHDNITFRRLNILRDEIPGQYDIVFAMDILEFAHGRWRLRSIMKRLAPAVRPQGILAVSMCRIPPELREAWWQTWLPEGGDAVVRLIATDPSLGMVHAEVHPNPGLHLEGYIDHVIAVFRKLEQSKNARAAG